MKNWQRQFLMGGGAAAATWWLDAVAAWQAKGAASYADSLVNLANPGTYDAATGVLPEWNAGVGWTFNGSTYLTTTLTALSTAWSMAVRFAAITDGNHGCGQYTNTADQFYVRPNLSGAASYTNGIRLTVSGGITAGVMMICGKAAYLNGSPVGTIPAGGATTGRPVGIGRINSDIALRMVGSVVAMAVWSRTLTPEEAASVSAAMGAL